MNTLKTQFSKIITIVFAIGLTAGCASVTDANLDSADDQQVRTVQVEKATSTWDSKTGDDMDPIIDKPDMGE